MHFSVITPTFNAGAEIEKTLESIFIQTDESFEYIIMDGGSRDDTKNVVEKASNNDKRIQFYSERDNGLYDAMNKGVQFAHGDYILFLGAGDTLCDENVLSDVWNIAVEMSQPDIIYGYVNMINKGNIQKYSRKVGLEYTLRLRPICHQAVFGKKSIVAEYPFDTNYRIVADQDWIMHMYKLKKTFFYVDRAISNYPMTGLSSNDGASVSSREYRKLRKKYYPIRGTIMDLASRLKK